MKISRNISPVSVCYSGLIHCVNWTLPESLIHCVAMICFHTGIPLSIDKIPGETYVRSYSVYGDVKEELPPDMPTPKVMLTCSMI